MVSGSVLGFGTSYSCLTGPDGIITSGNSRSLIGNGKGFPLNPCLNHRADSSTRSLDVERMNVPLEERCR